MGCPLITANGGDGCTYEMKRDDAKNAMFTVTNYTYWLTANDKGSGLGKVDLLIMDEGHTAVDAVSDYLGFKLYEDDIKNYADPKLMTDSYADWHELANEAMQDLDAESQG